MVHDGEFGEDGEEEILELYNSKQTEFYKDVDINPDLDPRQKKELLRLLERYQDVFSDVPGKTDIMKHEIQVTSVEPTRSKAYPTPYHLQKEIDKEIETMLKNGIIERIRVSLCCTSCSSEEGRRVQQTMLQLQTIE